MKQSFILKTNEVNEIHLNSMLINYVQKPEGAASDGSESRMHLWSPRLLTPALCPLRDNHMTWRSGMSRLISILLRKATFL